MFFQQTLNGGLQNEKKTEEERAHGEYATPETYKLRVLEVLDIEISRLKLYQHKQKTIESKRRNVEILRHSIPDSQGLDRLLRYAASLQRDFDRTLSQLERVQGVRKGKPSRPRSRSIFYDGPVMVVFEPG